MYEPQFLLQLLDSLVVPELQSSVEPLFFYLVLGFQHSEAAAFFKIAQKLPGSFYFFDSDNVIRFRVEIQKTS